MPNQKRDVNPLQDLFTPVKPKRAPKHDDGGVGRTLWAYRRELLLVGLLPAAALAVIRIPGVAALLILLLIGSFTHTEPWRLSASRWRWLPRWLRVSRVRRAWADANLACGFSYPTRRHGVRITDVQAVPVGDRLRVRLGRGLSAKALELRSHELAAALHVDDVRISKDRGDASRATITLIRNDPFADYIPDGKGREVIRPLPWPLRGASSFSLWDPIPTGIDETGENSSSGIILPDHNLLIGGEPGAGKSVALNIICAAGALDPTVHLWLFDGKVLELGPWQGVAERYVGPDVKEAIEAVQDLRKIMDERYQELNARHSKQLKPEHDLPIYLVVVDELAFYLSTTNTQAKAKIRELFRDLVARGRAAGIIFVGATQKPDADTIPSALRDLIGYRLALRCNTWQHSDTILGQGRASLGADASTIPGKQRGVGYLLAEGEQPVRTRGYFLSDDDVEQIAARAQVNRMEREWLAETS